MPGSPAFYNKVFLWMRERALNVLHLSFNEALSTVSHTPFLHPAQDVTAHITKGAERLAGCPGSALWAGIIL